MKTSRENAGVHKKSISINCSNITADIINLLEDCQGSLISPELLHHIHDLANGQSSSNRSFSSTLLSSKLSGYSSAPTTEATDAKLEELKEKLRLSQEAVHDRNKQIKEKDRLIEELKKSHTLN